MDSQFGDVFLFLTNLAWKSRVTIPLVLTTLLMVAGIRLHIVIDVETGRIEENHELDEESEDEWQTADSESEAEDIFSFQTTTEYQA